MFGECLGVWTALLFEKMKESQFLFTDNGFSIVEFGPGRATLMKDILRTLAQFGKIHDLHVNFVEASPYLQRVQQETIQQQLKSLGLFVTFEDRSERNKAPGVDGALNSCATLET